jgi:hypothetical protein
VQLHLPIPQTKLSSQGQLQKPLPLIKNVLQPCVHIYMRVHKPKALGKAYLPIKVQPHTTYMYSSLPCTQDNSCYA